MSDLRELAGAATPGPWLAEYAEENGGYLLLLGREAIEDRGSWHTGTRFEFAEGLWDRYDDGPLNEQEQAQFDTVKATAAFIASANPTAILALLDERDALVEVAVKLVLHSGSLVAPVGVTAVLTTDLKALAALAEKARGAS